MIDIQIIKGRFQQEVTDETSSTFSNRYILRKVTFPFDAIFYFETTGSKLQVEKAEVEINEDSGWFIQVAIDN